MQKTLLFLLLLACCLCRQSATAQSMKMPANIDSLPKGYLCFHTSGPVKIDGKLDDKAWKSAPWTDDFTDIQGDIQPKPCFRTRVKMLWDDSCFYIGAELEEPNVWATLKKRDTVIFYDNDFEVFMDPNGDNHEYYEMEMNAFNTVWDLFLPKPYKDSGSAVDSWNIKGLRTGVHINGTINNPRDKDKGWTAEIAMPWSSLKEYARRPAPPGEGERWRVNFSRVEWQTEIVKGHYQKIKGKPEDNWVWSPQGVIDMHRPEMWGYVQFTMLDSAVAQYHPDPSFGMRRILMHLYYSERSYRDAHKAYTDKLSELNPGNISDKELFGDPGIELTPGKYTATAIQRLPRGTIVKWHIRQDSKIWGSTK